MANEKIENESGVMGAVAAPTLTDLVEEFGPAWMLQQERFCWTATRRPTATAREVVTGRDLHQLATKLRAVMDGQG